MAPHLTTIACRNSVFIAIVLAASSYECPVIRDFYGVISPNCLFRWDYVASLSCIIEVQFDLTGGELGQDGLHPTIHFRMIGSIARDEFCDNRSERGG